MAHDQEVVGSIPGTVYWMDVSDLLAITFKTRPAWAGFKTAEVGIAIIMCNIW